MKGTGKASDIDIGRGTENAPLASLSKGAIYFLKLVTAINQKNVSMLYQTQSHNLHFKLAILKLTIEKSSKPTLTVYKF